MHQFTVFVMILVTLIAFAPALSQQEEYITKGNGWCWYRCGRKYGPCSLCGEGNWCCRKDRKGCESNPAMKAASINKSRCVGLKRTGGGLKPYRPVPGG